MSTTKSLRNAFFELGVVPDCPVYDMHGHMGPLGGASLPRCEPEQMIESMQRAGVRLTVFCHHAALFSADIGNSVNIDAVRRFPEHFRAYCGINANYPDEIEADLASFDDHADVCVGFKFLADYHKISIADPICRPVWEFANERKLIVLAHTWGGSQFDGPKPVRQIAEAYPDVTLLLGHSCHGAWEEAAAIAAEFANVYLELTAVLDDRGVVDMFVERTGSEKIVFGTDTPWFNHHNYIGALLGADISDDDRHNILHRNAERLLAPWL